MQPGSGSTRAISSAEWPAAIPRSTSSKSASVHACIYSAGLGTGAPLFSAPHVARHRRPDDGLLVLALDLPNDLEPPVVLDPAGSRGLRKNSERGSPCHPPRVLLRNATDVAFVVKSGTEDQLFYCHSLSYHSIITVAGTTSPLGAAGVAPPFTRGGRGTVVEDPPRVRPCTRRRTP